MTIQEEISQQQKRIAESKALLDRAEQLVAVCEAIEKDSAAEIRISGDCCGASICVGARHSKDERKYSHNAFTYRLRRTIREFLQEEIRSLQSSAMASLHPQPPEAPPKPAEPIAPPVGETIA